VGYSRETRGILQLRQFNKTPPLAEPEIKIASKLVSIAYSDEALA